MLVDTFVWFQFLFHKGNASPLPQVIRLKSAIEGGDDVYLLGIILTEILQGVRDPNQFKELEQSLRQFPLVEQKREDYVLAASLRNQCRAKGINAGTIDFLIAAASIRHDLPLLAIDGDFKHMASVISLKLC